MKRFILVIIFSIVFICFVESNAISNSTKESEETLEVRTYRGIILENGLKVILVSDPTSVASAASILVPAGSMNDPVEVPGIAHFCEHLLFNGNNKYPEPEEFHKFGASHGGIVGATTGADYTEYNFKVLASSLQGALDHLANMVISPLFRESALENEAKVVNAEHVQDIPNDKDRFDHIMTITSDPSHPYAKFITGTLETLWSIPKAKGINVRKLLKDFHENYYSSNIMTLAVLGEESLDQLEEIVETLFSKIPKRNVTLPLWPQSPLGPEQLQRKIEIVPISDYTYLTMEFPIKMKYADIMVNYHSAIISHSDEDALLSYLKKNNLAISVEAVVANEYRGFYTFRISVGLTEQGLAEWDLVVQHVFEYIVLLRGSCSQKWFWDETQEINVITERFKDESGPLELVKELASSIIEEDLLEEYVETLISTKESTSPYRRKLISLAFKAFKPTNMRLFIVSKSFENSTKLLEPFYSIHYNNDHLDSALIQKWAKVFKNPDMKLPTPNEFIPKNFDLKPLLLNNQSVPVIINETNLSKVWFAQNEKYQMPKGFVAIKIFSPYTYSSPVDEALNFILVQMITTTLSTVTDMALRAGIELTISNFEYGMEIIVEGFNDGIGKLLSKVMQNISTFGDNHCDPMLFTNVKREFRQILIVAGNENPCTLAKPGILLRETYWTSDEQLQVLDGIEMKRLFAFYELFMTRLKFEWLFFGNFLPEEVLEIVTKTEDLFTSQGTLSILSSEYKSRPRDVEIPQGSNWLYKMSSKANSITCSKILFQAESQELRQLVLIQLIARLMDQPAYLQLRSNEQLGYTVNVDCVRQLSGLSYVLEIHVEGGRAPVYVQTRIDNFLLQFNDMLKNMTEDEFEMKKQAVHDAWNIYWISIRTRGNAFWTEISSGHSNFQKEEQKVEILSRILLKEVQEFSEVFLGIKPGKQRRISIFVSSLRDNTTHCEDAQETSSNLLNLNEVEIINVVAWKKKQRLFASLVE